MGEKVNKSDEEWQEVLSPQQYAVCRLKGTEPAFTGAYWNHHAPGVYRCVACSAALFSSDAKFDSGTGWPSFSAPLSPDTVATEEDTSHSMRRTEVHCATCGSHLGHIFTDGPQPTGLRYCLNSICLDFVPKE